MDPLKTDPMDSGDRNGQFMLDRREAAAEIGISIPTLDRLLQRGEIPHVRIARRVLFVRASLRAWVKSLER